jgi:hypothetical protein
LCKHYRHIQKSQADQKYLYTFRSSTDSPDEVYWILSPPDVETISIQKTSVSLKRALQQRSPLIGSGHIAQHSCCTNITFITSTNARFGLILECSNNDNEDTCLGTDLTVMRTIQPGEQIYGSYTGDSDISDDWEDIFKCKCYYCACRGKCMSSEQQPTNEVTQESGQEIRHETTKDGSDPSRSYPTPPTGLPRSNT